MNLLQQYTQRAQAAHEQAEAAKDPRDKAAWKAAAQTWERLARPSKEPTYSMEPYRQQLTSLKRDAASFNDNDAPLIHSAPAETSKRSRTDGIGGASRRWNKTEHARAVDEYLSVEF